MHTAMTLSRISPDEHGHVRRLEFTDDSLLEIESWWSPQVSDRATTWPVGAAS